MLGRGIKPDLIYIQSKLGVKTGTALKGLIIDNCNKISMKEMADDVEPFLFNSSDVKKVLLFKEYLQQIDLQ